YSYPKRGLRRRKHSGDNRQLSIGAASFQMMIMTRKTRTEQLPFEGSDAPAITKARHRRSSFWLILFCVAWPGCKQRSPARPFEFSVKVYSDPGSPVRGASLLHGTTELGATGDDGSVR